MINQNIDLEKNYLKDSQMKNKMEEDKLTYEKLEQIVEELVAKEKTKEQVETTITFATSKENIDTIQQALKEFYSHIKTENNE